jgi:hypothetical protein
MNTAQISEWISSHGLFLGAVATVGLTALILGGYLTRAARRAGHARVITTLVNFAALMATAVQASGMWKFFGNTMGLAVGFRIVLFAFMEIGLLATGLRARANVEEGGDAGIDGILVWVFALASGAMSSSDASTTREAAMRIVVAMVVALLWTRDLMAAKRKARKTADGRKATTSIRWRITGERIFVWLRLADAVETDIAQLDAGRRVATFLRLKSRETNGWRWPLSAKARVNRQRLRMVRDALARSGESGEVYQTLAEQSRADAMRLLGVAADQTGPNGVRRPNGPGQPGPDRSEPNLSGPEDQPGTGLAVNVPESMNNRTGQNPATAPDQTGPANHRTRPANQAKHPPEPDETRPNWHTGPNRRSGGQGADRMKGSLDELDEVCRAWAADRGIDPGHMTRRAVVSACHAAGYSCSTERASDVQALLDPKGTTNKRERELTGPARPDHS